MNIITLEETIDRLLKNLSNDEKVLIVQQAMDKEEEGEGSYCRGSIGNLPNISTEYVCYNEKCEVETNDEDLYFERDEKCICGEKPRTQFEIINQQDISDLFQTIIDENDFDNIFSLMKEIKNNLSDLSQTLLYNIEHDEEEEYNE